MTNSPPGGRGSTAAPSLKGREQEVRETPGRGKGKGGKGRGATSHPSLLASHTFTPARQALDFITIGLISANLYITQPPQDRRTAGQGLVLLVETRCGTCGTNTRTLKGDGDAGKAPEGRGEGTEGEKGRCVRGTLNGRFSSAGRENAALACSRGPGRAVLLV